MKDISVDPVIVEFSKSHSKKECYLYNNRIYSMYINPSAQRRAEYHANWLFINTLPQ